MKTYFREFLSKVKESAFSILPFFGIIVVLALIFLPFNIYSILSIVVATLLMILGLSLFSVGVDMSAMKMGGYIGSNLSSSRRFSFMVIFSFVLGFIVTIAEPDLMVLAEQVPGISSKWIILITVSAGTGIFLILSTIRIIFRLSMKAILIISYILALALCCFAPSGFVPLSYDAIGVTTGAVSVPFIMSFGLGICAVRSGKNNQEDGFGLVALASIGPVIAILIVSMFLRGAGGEVVSDSASVISSASSWGSALGGAMVSYLWEVFIVIAPIFVFFLVYNFLFLKLPKSQVLRIFIGLIYCYMGLVLFLAGDASGYLPFAGVLGQTIGSGGTRWWVLPIALVVGFFLVFAEPAVHVLNKQVEDITEGVISRRTMMIAMSIGVSVAMLLVSLRAIIGFDFLWLIVPLTIVLCVLSALAPTLFVGIAFDSGGAAAGSLTASFVLPFIIGICKAGGYPELLYGFGTIGIISIMPTVVILIMGIRYQFILHVRSRTKKPKLKAVSDIEIIDF